MDARPIGVFDSGVGGLTVLHECLVTLPHEDFIYFGDSSPERFPVRPEAGRDDPPLCPRDRPPPRTARREAAGGGLQLGHLGGAARPAARVRGAADRRHHARGARRRAGHARPPSGRDGDRGDGRERPLSGRDRGARRGRRGDPGGLSRPGAADPVRRRQRPRVARGGQALRRAAQVGGRGHRDPRLHALPADPADAAADLRPRRLADHVGRGGRARGGGHARPSPASATIPTARGDTGSSAPATRAPSWRWRGGSFSCR